MLFVSRKMVEPGAGPACDVRDLLEQARRLAAASPPAFSLPMRLLPRALRPDVQLLHLVARSVDGLVAERLPQACSRLDAVERWALTGRVDCREARVLQHLAERHSGLPRDAVVDFCDGMRRDLAGVHLETEPDLDVYAYQVAGTVGRLAAAVLGTRGPEADAAARALGIAMRRTSILRDIDEDLAAGRVYVPAATLDKAGVRNLQTDDRTVVLRVGSAIAHGWYERGLAGIPDLLHGRAAARCAALLHREILRQLGRDSRGRRRPRPSPLRTSWLVVRSTASR